MGDRAFRILYPDRVDPEELLSVLSSHFGGAEGDREGGVFFRGAEDFRVRVRVDDDAIVELEFGSGITVPEVDELAREIREKLIEDQAPVVARRVVFCNVPVVGHFAAPEDAFRLIAAPPQAPRPPAFVGDHPLVIAFPATSSPDGFIMVHRTGRALARWTWFLNAVLLDQFKTYSRSRQAWFLSVDPDLVKGEPGGRWGSEGYASRIGRLRPTVSRCRRVLESVSGPKATTTVDPGYPSMKRSRSQTRSRVTSVGS